MNKSAEQDQQAKMEAHVVGKHLLDTSRAGQRSEQSKAVTLKGYSNSSSSSCLCLPTRPHLLLQTFPYPFKCLFVCLYPLKIICCPPLCALSYPCSSPIPPYPLTPLSLTYAVLLVMVKLHTASIMSLNL
jgi:hypothetical protein